MRSGRLATRVLLTLALTLLCRVPAHAQFGAFEGLFQQITDVNFYAGSTLSSGAVGRGALNVSLFGVELLYDLGSTYRQTPGDSAVALRRTLTGVEVTWEGDRADSTFTYSVAAERGGEPLVSFELGLGYGQISSLYLESGGYTMTGAVREFPAASLYAAHAPTALYAGLRSGLIQTSNLQAYDAAGVTTRAASSAFQGGAVIGFAPNALTVFPFVELGWIYRTFGSVDWEGDTVPPALPRRLDVGGWQLVVGIQSALRR